MAAMKIKHNPELSIVVPVYNSSECLNELAAKVTDALKSMSYELILVNDCSRDDSWEVIRAISNRFKSVIGINLRKNSGQDNAIMAGFSIIRGSYVVVMDDDLQHDPYDIPRLYEEVRKGYDVCYADFSQKHQALWKNIGSYVNDKIAEITIGKPSYIYLSPFKIINAELIREVLKYQGPYPYVDGLLFERTSNITQILAEHHERFSGKSNYDFMRSLRVFAKHLTNFSIYPLRIATKLGFLSAFIGLVLAIYYILEYFITKTPVHGWTSITVIELFIGGINLICLGLVGEYLGRAYLNINQKPQFNIKEIVGEKLKKDPGRRIKKNGYKK